MIKLDKQNRLQIITDVRAVAGFSIPCKVYCIYDNGTLVLKPNPELGKDRVVYSLVIDSHGRIVAGKLFDLIGFDKTGEYLLWAEPGAVHIEKAGDK